MSVCSRLTREQARSLLVPYGIEVVRVEPVHGGRVNANFRIETGNGDSLFFRVYRQQRAREVEQELQLVSELGRAGAPTPLFVPRIDGGRLCEHEGKPAALFRWIDGTWLCQRSVTPGICRTVGTAVARLHQMSESCRSAPTDRFGPEALLERLTDVATADRADLVSAAARVRRDIEEHANRRDGGLPRGIVHGDLFRENVLWHEGRLTAFVDFECACSGPFVYDLMVCVLAWCYGASFEWPLVRGMLEGYMGRRVLSSREIAALGAEACWACLRFATTRLSDFSMSAGPEGPQRDYRRFLQRLAELETGASCEMTRLAAQIAQDAEDRRFAIGIES